MADHPPERPQPTFWERYEAPAQVISALVGLFFLGVWAVPRLRRVFEHRGIPVGVIWPVALALFIVLVLYWRFVSAPRQFASNLAAPHVSQPLAAASATSRSSAVDPSEIERLRKLRTLCALAASEMRKNIRLLERAQRDGRYWDPADDRLTANYLDERHFATEPLTKMALDATELAGDWIARVNELVAKKASAMREAIPFPAETAEVRPPLRTDDLDEPIRKLRLAENWFDGTAHQLDEKL